MQGLPQPQFENITSNGALNTRLVSSKSVVTGLLTSARHSAIAFHARGRGFKSHQDIHVSLLLLLYSVTYKWHNSGDIPSVRPMFLYTGVVLVH